jgi:hypothetical protein
VSNSAQSDHPVLLQKKGKGGEVVLPRHEIVWDFLFCVSVCSWCQIRRDIKDFIFFFTLSKALF